MARILISEPEQLTRNMIERMLVRLGHEPVLARVPMPAHFAEVDLYVCDTAGSLGVTRPQAARAAEPALPAATSGTERDPARATAHQGAEREPCFSTSSANVGQACAARRACASSLGSSGCSSMIG
jgi:hypothetical protein